jgi:hypothetical protein
MVLVADMELYGGGRWRKITGVKASFGEYTYHSENYGNSLLFDVRSVVSPPTKRFRPYGFSTRLSTPNYAPVMPLPDTTINNSFKLELKLRLAWESTDLVNEGSNFNVIVSYPNYAVMLGQQFAASFRYGVKISGENISLNHRNFITQLPTPAPTSLLL